MSFLAYVIAWFIIVFCLLIAFSLINRLIIYLRDYTALGRRYHEKRFKDINDLAIEIVNEMDRRKTVDFVYE